MKIAVIGGSGSAAPGLRSEHGGQTPAASSPVSCAAEISLHPLASCPDHSGEKSPLPRLSALVRSGATTAAASGNAGTSALIGPTSRTIRFTIPRAGLPVNTFVSAVCRAPSLFNAALWTALVLASGHSR